MMSKTRQWIFRGLCICLTISMIAASAVGNARAEELATEKESILSNSYVTVYKNTVTTSVWDLLYEEEGTVSFSYPSFESQNSTLEQFLTESIQDPILAARSQQLARNTEKIVTEYADIVPWIGERSSHTTPQALVENAFISGGCAVTQIHDRFLQISQSYYWPAYYSGYVGGDDIDGFTNTYLVDLKRQNWITIFDLFDDDEKTVKEELSKYIQGYVEDDDYLYIPPGWYSDTFDVSFGIENDLLILKNSVFVDEDSGYPTYVTVENRSLRLTPSEVHDALGLNVVIR